MDVPHESVDMGSEDSPRPPSASDTVAIKRTAEAALHNTTPSRLRSAKRANDGNEEASRQATPDSPTRKLSATALRFKKKIAGSQMMTSRPIDPSGDGNPAPNPSFPDHLITHPADAYTRHEWTRTCPL
ncbi:hypothetical protein M422DRAFT_274477 [Sphaerobolus stellatus SS14]|uniref:Uncharacterized protein n=1 Tax=Sphaerobolus stellatus (strain SS14) TaxID=990650 RepID=A0A0C9U6D6_SPHS4|nr:hypothetical protein M422DRAFT_274477 [Sphaerobolus stellatus SS14]